MAGLEELADIEIPCFLESARDTTKQSTNHDDRGDALRNDRQQYCEGHYEV